MNYRKHYDALMNKAKQRNYMTLPYYEVHHIIPKSEGGLDEENNYARLTAREHFLAHWLLYRENPEIKSRAFSFWRMCNGRGKVAPEHWITISSRCYEEAKLAHSKNISEALKGKKKSPEHAAKVGAANKGKKRTEEQKAKMRKKHTYTKEGYERLVSARLNKTPTSAKRVIMLNKDTFQELKNFPSIREAGKFTNLHGSNIFFAIKTGGLSGNYRWKFENQSTYVKKPTIEERLGKRVFQYDKEGNLINEWSSIASAAKALNFANSYVWKCCHRELEDYKGFRWSFKYKTKDGH